MERIKKALEKKTSSVVTLTNKQRSFSNLQKLKSPFRESSVLNLFPEITSEKIRAAAVSIGSSIHKQPSKKTLQIETKNLGSKEPPLVAPSKKINLLKNSNFPNSLLPEIYSRASKPILRKKPKKRTKPNYLIEGEKKSINSRLDKYARFSKKKKQTKFEIALGTSYYSED